MFGEEAFRTWPVVMAGALCFAALFALVALLVEVLFEGHFRVTRTVVGFGVAAFVGYVGTALLLRRGGPPPSET